MLAQVIVLAWGLAMRGPATPAGAPSAESCADRIAPCAPDSIRAAAVRQARTATRDGAWNDAAELWQDALILDGRRGADWLALGDVLVRADRYREAAAAYQRAIQVDARLTEAGTRGVARAYARMGDDRQAVRWLEQALRLGARPAEHQRARLRRIGNLVEAVLVIALIPLVLGVFGVYADLLGAFR